MHYLFKWLTYFCVTDRKAIYGCQQEKVPIMEDSLVDVLSASRVSGSKNKATGNVWGPFNKTLIVLREVEDRKEK